MELSATGAGSPASGMSCAVLSIFQLVLTTICSDADAKLHNSFVQLTESQFRGGYRGKRPLMVHTCPEVSLSRTKLKQVSFAPMRCARLLIISSPLCANNWRTNDGAQIFLSVQDAVIRDELSYLIS